jgi:hypothetical protein
VYPIIRFTRFYSTCTQILKCQFSQLSFLETDAYFL